MDEVDAADRLTAKVVLGCVFMAVSGIAGCDIHETQVKISAMAAMVEKGADPIAARCAVYGFKDTELLCQQVRQP